MKNPRDVAVVYSLPSSRMRQTKYSEADEDSAIIAEKVKQGLEFSGYRVILYPIAEDEIEKIAEIKTECIFNLIEWCGEDIHLSEKAFAFLRNLQIPVTGSSEEIFVLTGDKVRMKDELEKHKVSTPFGLCFETGEEEIPGKLPYPMIVKPSLEHCSIGITHDSIAKNDSELRSIVRQQIDTFHQPALAEEFIEGREFLVYMYEEKEEVKVLPVEEVIFAENNPQSFQTYEAKWETDNPEYKSTEVRLAKLTQNEQNIIDKVCKDAFKKMQLRGYSRFDVRFKNGVPYILETNANPSVYDAESENLEINSEVIWGIKFPDYLQKIVQSAIYHFENGERV